VSSKPEYRIYALKFAGPFVRSRALMMWLQDWDVKIEANHYFWFLQWGGEGIVVDAGYPPKLARERDITTYVNPVEMLGRIGVKAEAVKHLVLTHLHWDHAAGATLFPNARLYVQEDEFNFWTDDPIARRAPFANPFTTDQTSLMLLSRLRWSDRLVLLKGDEMIIPGVECLLAPGHTAGLQAVAVSTEKGTAILGSDCAHTFENYREDWPSSLIFDLKAWLKSYDKLRAKASSPDLLFPGHDPLMTTNYPKIAKDITRLA